jgi:two-component system OmpR family sensor kinase
VRHHLHRRHRGRSRFFWRVYLNGLLLLGLVAVAVVVAGAAMGPHGPGMRPERIVEYAAAQTAEALHDPARLAEILLRANQAFGVEVAVFDGDRLVAANVDPPPPPLPPSERYRLGSGSAFRIPGRTWAWAAPLHGAPGAYAVLAGGWKPFQVARVAVVIGAVLLALAIASVPLARGITAPIERLTVAVQRLGEGDLSARAGLCGRGEVGDLGRAFDEMAGRLERLVRAERELLASVSHELRTPLARIRVALELAAEGDQARARRFLAEIGTDLTELERMVEDVLTAARLDQGDGALPLRRQPVELARLMAEAAARFREQRPSRTLTVRTEGLTGPVDADPALLRRALDNLLDNAAKYSGPAAPVELSASGGPGAVEIAVRDQGIGIEPADLPRLFTPFFRTDRSRARGTGGVGLGLALVRRIAEAHGGSVEVESLPDRGSTFRIRLPAGGAAGT